MCKYCEHEEPILKGTLETFKDAYLFGVKPNDMVKGSDMFEAFEDTKIKVFYDTRGYLRLVAGDDTNCLDHSIDLVKINNCPVCGKEFPGRGLHV